MTVRDPLPWNELFELHVIKKLVKLVNRRWSLGVGYVDGEGREARAPRTNQFAPARGLCQVVQGRAAGELACAEMAHTTGQGFRDAAARHALMAGAVTTRCHAGLYELAAPVVVEGRYLGALLCGGFLIAEGGAGAAAADLAAVDRQVGPLALPPADYQHARDRQPVLGRDEVAYVGELLELAAEEVVEYLADIARRERRTGELEREFTTRYAYDSLIGRSQPMQDLYRLLDRVIDSDSTVLISGENGTGKELVARAIHFNSARKNRRFLVQNCSAFNDNLLDSELFGHKKGAFTGAIADKQGLFEVADRGTFFLDEIGDMSPALQVKLLRVLQEGTFTAVGDTEVKEVDVRIIAATNRDLKRMVDHGEFREDLYYRVNVINLTIPPLRERRDDIDLLIDHFLKRHAKGGRLRMKRLSSGCLERMLGYPWPGNVRELENEIERLVVLAGDEKVINEQLLSARIRQQAPIGGPLPSATPHSLPDAVDALERAMIHDALRRTGGNKTRAAAELRISRRNLIRLVQKYELEPSRVPN